VAAREQQRPARRCVGPGELGELAVEVLEVEWNRKRRRVLEQQDAHLAEIGLVANGHEFLVAHVDTLPARNRHRHVRF
jgi:hypothetical protein